MYYLITDQYLQISIKRPLASWNSTIFRNANQFGIKKRYRPSPNFKYLKCTTILPKLWRKKWGQYFGNVHFQTLLYIVKTIATFSNTVCSPLPDFIYQNFIFIGCPELEFHYCPCFTLWITKSLPYQTIMCTYISAVVWIDFSEIAWVYC